MTQQLGRYELLEEIGRGGFAIVYRARDTELDRLVALKELKPLLLQDEEWVRRFRREARAIARLDHRHIVPIYDVGEAEARLFIVTRLVAGPSLDELIAARGYLPWSESIDIITAVAEGLGYAHAQGILHRDLKPANILIDPKRGPMLTDFGLAKLAGEGSSSVTANRGVVGTPHYIAPEVWEGQGTTPQTDIYALGCILYELLTGEKVFKGETSPAVMMAHFKPLELPQIWPEGVPSGIADVLNKALANKPEQRYATAEEMIAALAALREKLPVPAVVSNHPPVQATGAAPAQPEDDPEQITTPWIEPTADLFQDEAEQEPQSQTANKWREFLTHLGPYIIVIGGLGLLNVVTDPGGYLWCLWPALAWGIGLTFHLFDVVMSGIINLQGKWRDFTWHFGSYAIVMAGFLGIYLMTDPGGYPWFMWPAMGWGIGLAIHLWTTLLGQDHHHEDKEQRRASKKQRKARRHAEKAQAKQAAQLDPAIQSHLDKARTYKAQINTLIRSTTDQNVYSRLQDLANQIDGWTQAVEALARRINNFQKDALIQHDLKSVPPAIAKLEAQLARETDPATQAELKRTLNNRKNQLAALQHLQNTMKRAEIKIESTLSALGTIYSQILIGQSANQVADYGRLSTQVDEEVRTLQDHLEALEEVKLGNIGYQS